MPYRPARWLVSADDRAESLHVRVMLLPRPRLDSDSIVDCHTCDVQLVREHSTAHVNGNVMKVQAST